MKVGFAVQQRWLLWVSMLGFFLALWVYPPAHRITRILQVSFFLVTWFGLLFLVWRLGKIRLSILLMTALGIGFLLWPGGQKLPANRLRAEYLAGLKAYEATRYYWGGESWRGIDCSGLVRRGMIDALFRSGYRHLNPGMVRQAMALWWNDCSAKALSEHYDNLTVYVLDTPSLNALDHTRIQPGDLAVTANGIHILAYLGGNTWIEADPGERKVICITPPIKGNVWLESPMKIVRWQMLVDAL